MRTRRSNQAKRYTLDEYDFLESASEAEDAPITGRSKKGKGKAKAKVKNEDEDEDANFDQYAKDGDGEEEEAEDEENDGDDYDAEEADAAAAEGGTYSGSEGAEDDDDDEDAQGDAATAGARSKRQKPRGGSRKMPGDASAGYLRAEPFPADPHLPRGYTGTFERHVRGGALVKAWYGDRPGGVETAARLINSLGEWTVLPPKTGGGGERRCIWEDAGFFDAERERCDVWRAKLEAAGKRTVLRTIRGDEAAPYRLSGDRMPVLLGPEQAEHSSCPGVARLLSHTDLLFEEDEREDKIPAGWILDAGGIVTDLDWAATGTDELEPQLLALAVVPFGDHEMFDYESEAAKPGFQGHGTVQLWEFRGERNEHGVLRPAATGTPARLVKTLCLDKGRARQVAWSPACLHLAVLCTDGNVYVVKPGSGDGSHGKAIFHARREKKRDEEITNTYME